MPVIVENSQLFCLTNTFFSYVFRVNEVGILEHVYYGAPISNPNQAQHSHKLTERALTSNFEGVRHFNLDDIPSEYPCFGRSDFRIPAVHGRNHEGNSVFSFHYKSHEITSTKPNLDGLPSARGGNSETLIIHLEDDVLNLKLNLHYTVYEDFGVLCKSITLINNSDHPISLEAVASTSLNFVPIDYEVLHLHGSWAREMNEERLSIPFGKFIIDSTGGSSSAQHHPFIAIMQNGTNEDFGEVYGSTLVYSGNFAFSVEKNEFSSVRLIGGINPFNFNWQLLPGQNFTSPEALHVYSPNGLENMSHQWHQFIRNQISPTRFRYTPRPSYINTWEACYFDVSSSKVLSLADEAVELGLEMIVLDDGWFGDRDDDTTSLGDWFENEKKFPEGIPWLAAQVKSKGLKFGLWFEPEMVNPESKLFKKHPDWIIHIPGRKSSLGRNQLTLDLTRPDVREYIFNAVDKLLSCGDIDYIKWDMNRAMTELGSTFLPKEQQGEVAHRYIIGLYEILDRLTSKYPDVLFENCASGGNRGDLGMLYYFPQTWTSDMCDPIGRLDIIHGASYLYPSNLLTAYVGPSPNHQNGRVTSLNTRFLAGIFCAGRGYSLNKKDLHAHKDAIKNQVQFIKRTQEDVLDGKFYRLLKKENQVCWQYNNADASSIYLCYFHLLSRPNLPYHIIKMKDLNPDARYRRKDNSEIYNGDTLMNNGLPLPYVTVFQNDITNTFMPKEDFSSYLIEFKKVDEGI